MLAIIAGMPHNSTLLVSALVSGKTLDLAGLSEAQEGACYAALCEFLERNHLASWGLRVNRSKAGPRTWRLDISVAAPPEFDFQVRSSQMTVDETVDLGQLADLCLETHYNACMNRKATRPSISPSPKTVGRIDAAPAIQSHSNVKVANSSR